MKKFISILICALMLMSVAFAETAQPETVTITSFNGSYEAVELTVPYDPQRIAILDMASLDILNALGLSDRVVGSASTSLDYLKDIVNAEGVENLGNIML